MAVVADAILVSALAFGLLAGVAVLTSRVKISPSDDQAILLLAIAGPVAFLLLNGLLLAIRGQTVGKLLFRTRIVRSDGERAGFIRIYGVRYLLMQMIYVIPVAGGIFALIDALLIFAGNEQRCLHDRIAGTYVVDLNRLDT